MRLFLYAVAVGALFLSCDSTDPAGDTQDPTFTLKYINRGGLPVTALFLKPLTDTANWGVSVLPVDTLDSLQYVLLSGLASGPTYAFRSQFDSAGVAVYLTHDWMPTGPDTITGYAAKGLVGWETGHSWGLQVYTGEQDVTP